MEYGKTNNIKLTSRLPWRASYLFADTPSHRADKLFIRSEVPVRFSRKEMGHPDHPYVLVFCHFRKRYEDRFLQCMADLERTMLLEGYSDYGDFCGKVLVPLLEKERERSGFPWGKEET